MSDSLVSMRNLHISFKTDRGELDAINGISLEIGRGEIFGLVGETGCGKTVTGLSLIGLLPGSAHIRQGEIYFEGEDLRAKSEREMSDLRGQRISMIFQNPGTALNPVFTVDEQMTRVTREHLGLSKKQSSLRAGEMLEAVGLADVERVLAAYPHQLSGGMLQRVMIAMALLCQPALIIADEPTTALDVTIQAQILALLRNLREEFGVSILLITHDLGVVAHTCDRVAVLYAGRVAETGRVQEILGAPHHPYTSGLLAAIPTTAQRGSELVAIPGSVPANPGAVVGCAFAPRCRYVFDRCHTQAPDLRTVGPGRQQSACFLEAIPEAER